MDRACALQLPLANFHRPLPEWAQWLKPQAMTFDDQLQRYFGTTDMADVPAAAVIAGLERMRVDFGLEKDRGRRFALWTVMFILGDAPDLDIAFEDEADRNTARDFMDLMDSIPKAEPSV